MIETEEAIAQEREACAVVCDQIARNAEYRAMSYEDEAAKAVALAKVEAARLCAASIRERGV
jgi:hypothetical protein